MVVHVHTHRKDTVNCTNPGYKHLSPGFSPQGYIFCTISTWKSECSAPLRWMYGKYLDFWGDIYIVYILANKNVSIIAIFMTVYGC